MRPSSSSSYGGELLYVLSWSTMDLSGFWEACGVSSCSLSLGLLSLGLGLWWLRLERCWLGLELCWLVLRLCARGLDVCWLGLGLSCCLAHWCSASWYIAGNANRTSAEHCLEMRTELDWSSMISVSELAWLIFCCWRFVACCSSQIGSDRAWADILISPSVEIATPHVCCIKWFSVDGVVWAK